MSNSEFLDAMRAILMPDVQSKPQKYEVHHSGRYVVAIKGKGSLALSVNRVIVAQVLHEDSQESSSLSRIMELKKGDVVGVVGNMQDIHVQAMPQ